VNLMRRTPFFAGLILVLLTACDNLSGPSGPGPAITAIAPAALAAGDTATIDGGGFSTTARENQVTINGMAGVVLAATASRITVELPGPDAFPCGPAGEVTVAVSVGERQATALHRAEGAIPWTLAPGESVAVHGSRLDCTELTAGGTYVISVFNTSTTPTAMTAFRLRGAGTAVAGDAMGFDALTSDSGGLGIGALGAGYSHHRGSGAEAGFDPSAETHAWILEANTRLARELVHRGLPARRSPATALMTAPAELGTLRAFRITDPDSIDWCMSFETITARAVYSGPTAVIWEDTLAPLAWQMNARWQELGEEYEQVMHPIIREYFGDPLAFDPWIGNPGRVHMVFSPRVNNFDRGVAGFAFTGDFFPASATTGGSCAASNEAATFYGRVPTDGGGGFGPGTVGGWARQMRSIVIHEVKHIVSFAERLRIAVEGSRQPVYETEWLEESTAQLAEEYYARAVSGYGQGGNVTYQQSVWCEVRVSGACEAIPAIMVRHFEAIYRYYEAVGDRSVLGRVDRKDWTFYGSGWLFVRWALDHSGKSEEAFTRALVTEPHLTGMANLAARMGRPFPEMFAHFTLAMVMDDYPGGPQTRPELSFPGWNTRDIMSGLHRDFEGHFPASWPLQARNIGPGSFDVEVAGIRGGTATFFRLAAGPGSGALVQLIGAAGGTAPGNLGIAIVRID
jgi:hypothetical protein